MRISKSSLCKTRKPSELLDMRISSSGLIELRIKLFFALYWEKYLKLKPNLFIIACSIYCNKVEYKLSSFPENFGGDCKLEFSPCQRINDTNFPVWWRKWINSFRFKTFVPNFSLLAICILCWVQDYDKQKVNLFDQIVIKHMYNVPQLRQRMRQNSTKSHSIYLSE